MPPPESRDSTGVLTPEIAPVFEAMAERGMVAGVADAWRVVTDGGGEAAGDTAWRSFCRIGEKGDVVSIRTPEMPQEIFQGEFRLQVERLG